MVQHTDSWNISNSLLRFSSADKPRGAWIICMIRSGETGFKRVHTIGEVIAKETACRVA